MKDSKEYTSRLKKLISDLKRAVGASAKFDSFSPMEALVFGCLSEVTTRNKARAAMNKIQSHYVDLNELRVTRVEELIDVLGKSYSQVRQTSQQILALLHEVYQLRDSLNLQFLCEGTKQQARTYLEGLVHTTPYIIDIAMLYSIDAHAFPIHPPMTEMLGKEEVVDPAEEVDAVKRFLERHIAAKDIKKVYALFRYHADHYRPRKATAKKAATEKKKTTKKKTTTRTKKKTS